LDIPHEHLILVKYGRPVPAGTGKPTGGWNKNRFASCKQMPDAGCWIPDEKDFSQSSSGVKSKHQDAHLKPWPKPEQVDKG
jgi:hypothetical protein